LKVSEHRKMTVSYLKDWDSWVEELARP
jgi:hypothetical protein